MDFSSNFVLLLKNKGEQRNNSKNNNKNSKKETNAVIYYVFISSPLTYFGTSLLPLTFIISQALFKFFFFFILIYLF